MDPSLYFLWSCLTDAVRSDAVALARPISRYLLLSHQGPSRFTTMFELLKSAFKARSVKEFTNRCYNVCPIDFDKSPFFSSGSSIRQCAAFSRFPPYFFISSQSPPERMGSLIPELFRFLFRPMCLLASVLSNHPPGLVCDRF